MELRGVIMGLFGWILYIFLGIILFLCLCFLERKYSISRLQKFVFSIIIWLVFCGVCFHFAIPYTSDIFLVFVFLMIMDIFYCSYFLDQDFFDKQEKRIFYYIILVLCGFFINQEFVNKVHSIFLTGEELREVLWFGIILFLYQFGKRQNIFEFALKSTEGKISEESVLLQYTRLKYRYGKNLHFKNKDLSHLVYAIMIFESSRRSKILRSFDYFMFRFNGNQKKLGIMQVETNHFITDIESIEIVYEELEKLYLKKSSLRGEKRIISVLEEYCGEEKDSVRFLFDIIRKF